MLKSGIFFTQSMCGLDFVFQLGGDFVEADLGGGSGSEATVWVQGNTSRVEELEGSLDAGDYFIRRIDLAGITTDATEADLEVFAQIFKHSHVARSRSGEFHGKMVHLQPVELAENWSVASGVGGFASGARTGATAEVYGNLDFIETFDDLVDHIDTEVSGMFWVVIFSADIGIDEQAKVRVVNLNNGNAFFAQQFNFTAKDGDAVGDERLARGVSGT